MHLSLLWCIEVTFSRSKAAQSHVRASWVSIILERKFEKNPRCFESSLVPTTCTFRINRNIIASNCLGTVSRLKKLLTTK